MEHHTKYADIIIDISTKHVDRVFQYRIPSALEDEIQVGCRVEVPFGKGDTVRKGYVVSITTVPTFAPEKTKEIRNMVPGAVSIQEQMILLAWWMKERYGSTMNQALKTVLPVKAKIAPKEEKTIVSKKSEQELRELLKEAERKNHKARIRLYQALLENGALPYRLTAEKLGITMTMLKPLSEKGTIDILAEKKSRDPICCRDTEQGKLVLNEEQQRAVDTVIRDFDSGKRDTYLLYGITGSGKTEVYMELIEYVICQGKQAIVLIPEISLTYQTVMRFYRRFGNRVSIINSRLSAGERYDQLERAANGEIDIMIGPRSALFTPFANLGLIIMDEEHEGAYKSENVPRYHAREVAEMRAQMNHASLILGSATPSMESYHRALNGKYQLLTLHNRAKKNSRLANVHVVDLREELAEGNRSVFSRKLRELMEDRLSKGEQIMLFMNRRGYANFVSCRSCGETLRCPHCDVSLTYHNDGRLKCHYCGHEVWMPKNCPGCGSPYIAPFGTGTQKLEDMTRKTFPDARIIRMDADTTSTKGAHEEILQTFAEGDADILIGTQMIVKGHDFPKVTLVGIMAADLSLYVPDFRSGERTFELITQASGRAGRGDIPGDVVIQSYTPDHFAITAAADQDYEQFYRQEMLYRKMMAYPPAVGLVCITLSSKDEAALNRGMERLYREILKEYCLDGVVFIGPVDASPYKVNDIYRKNLYIKHESYDILLKIRKSVQKMEGLDQYKKISFQYDG
ncbi:MAG: primosomal protein N' [Lachnospiraceae bacterium]|nr:primosomal protein N' [Lachnospiraceae bacterium]